MPSGGDDVLRADAFAAPVPIGQNADAAAAGRSIGTLFVAWLVLSYVLKQRWAGAVLADERNARIDLAASQWGRGATAPCVIAIAIAVLLGFSDTTRLQAFSHAEHLVVQGSHAEPLDEFSKMEAFLAAHFAQACQ